jgi:hypothetical protein
MTIHRPHRPVLLAAVLATLGAAGCGRGERGSGSGGGRDRIAGIGLSSPETVAWDSLSDLYLVSNVNGDPGAKDGNGFISRIAPDGRVVALRWIAGGGAGATLNAPKGMAIVVDSLFVADLDAVRVFDRRTGAPLRTVPVPGASGLNGIAVGPDGRVWVTDLEGGGVYRIEGANAVAVQEAGAAAGQPNGIAPLARAWRWRRSAATRSTGWTGRESGRRSRGCRPAGWTACCACPTARWP